VYGTCAQPKIYEKKDILISTSEMRTEVKHLKFEIS